MSLKVKARETNPIKFYRCNRIAGGASCDSRVNLFETRCEVSN